MSWLTTKRQINTSFALARDQMRTSLETANKQITAPMRQAWINKLRELLAELISSAEHYYVVGFDRTEEGDRRRAGLREDEAGSGPGQPSGEGKSSTTESP